MDLKGIASFISQLLPEFIEDLAESRELDMVRE
jgi:hypothetical protein